MQKKARTPLIDQLSAHIRAARTGFHTPGHQDERGFPPEFLQLAGMRGLLALDLTEIEGLDNLREPCGCLKESQQLAAQLFGAEQTFYLVNGSSIGLQAALLAVNKPAEKIIVPRNVHISAINGLVLSGGRPVYASAEIEKEWGFPLGVAPEQLINTQKQHPDAAAVLLTNPEYRGVSADISRAINDLREMHLTVLVDEAHGAHLYFQDDAPLSAQRLQPDIVVQSAHKTLPVFTQASLLHVNKSKWKEPVQAALRVLQTTSPSYLLLASLDALQAELRERGRELTGQAAAAAGLFREKVSLLDGYRIYKAPREQGWLQDKTKVLVSAAQLGLAGWELAELLAGQGIIVEMSDYYYVLFLFHSGHTAQDAERAYTALKGIRAGRTRKPLVPWAISSAVFEQTVQPAVSPREAFFAPKETIRIKDAAGRIAGEAWTLCPPGIPLVLPGEIITAGQIEYILETKYIRNKAGGIPVNEMITVLSG